MVTRNPKFPAPDRSNFTPNQFTKDEVMPEGDLGGFSGVLADGRPYVVENWYREGFTFITVFFSVLDLEATPEVLLELVRPVLADARVPDEYQCLYANGIYKTKDASGNELFSLTFCVGAPEA